MTLQSIRYEAIRFELSFYAHTAHTPLCGCICAQRCGWHFFGECACIGHWIQYYCVIDMDHGSNALEAEHAFSLIFFPLFACRSVLAGSHTPCTKCWIYVNTITRNDCGTGVCNSRCTTFYGVVTAHWFRNMRATFECNLCINGLSLGCMRDTSEAIWFMDNNVEASDKWMLTNPSSRVAFSFFDLFHFVLCGRHTPTTVRLAYPRHVSSSTV